MMTKRLQVGSHFFVPEILSSARDITMLIGEVLRREDFVGSGALDQEGTPLVFCNWDSSCRHKNLLVEVFEDTCRALASADAHGHHAVLGFSAIHLAQNGRSQLGAGASQWVSERAGSAVRVHLLRVETRL